MKLKTIAVLVCAVALAGCGTTSLADLTTHLNERGCAHKGSAHASAGMTGGTIAGDVTWDCTGVRRTEVEKKDAQGAE